MAAGIEWVFPKPDGERYGERLPSFTFRQIVADAGLPEGTSAHSLKDLAVQWARDARIPDDTFSEHADTSTRTINRNYGPSRKIELLEAAAEQITQKAWREKEERRAAQAADFLARRDEAYAAAAAAKAEARRAARRAKAARKRKASAPGPAPGAPTPAAVVVPMRPPGATAGGAAAAPAPGRRAVAARASS
ncbi:hypothetical protein [Bradyrhizobium japonicum]|uniref:hypothetical protein n=1 Tax=Bradyrhizobium japonicum TaxID=375 RepID=UPI00271543C3|nr:hypothetical protein [Bradyrhizobium japonicum]WLB23970.1 hypothetical protein QIH95_49310 [Bradyrhizobium japonicum]